MTNCRCSTEGCDCGQVPEGSLQAAKKNRRVVFFVCVRELRCRVGHSNMFLKGTLVEVDLLLVFLVFVGRSNSSIYIMYKLQST